ncbi:MAG: response regulator transcription factor [Synergistaceae bacterium]|jgi:two-component system response regulator CpxR|nr:response regulator transcription factor [Synergistaceae bacterium]
MAKSIMMIDDDKNLIALLEEYFISEGFKCTGVTSGDEGLELFARGEYDIILLDVMLPGRDGIEILKEIRSHSSVPVIMLTAKGDPIDRVLGLEFGADDYICKPFIMQELSARIRAVLRRINVILDATQDVISVADLEMDLKSRSVKIGGQGIPLTNVEFRILENLLSYVSATISSEKLSMNVLGRNLSPFDRSLSVHISKLRRKLGAYPCGSERIKTIRGEGFMYVFPQ